MSKLFLMQHGKNLPKEIDQEEGLSSDGKDEIYRSAKAMKALGVHLDLIVSSPKKRAVETAEIVANVLELGKNQMMQSDAFKALAPSEESIYFCQQRKKDSLLLVGHLPSLMQIASYLLSDERINLHIENGGISYIAIDAWKKKGGSLKWHLPFSLLERLPIS